MTTDSPSTVGSVATRTSSMSGRGRVQRDAAVLRLPALRDVELREHLQARRHAGDHPLDPLHLVQHAVDPELHDERVLLRLEVDVGRSVFGRLEDHGVDEADERRVRDAVVDFEVVGSPLPLRRRFFVDGGARAECLGGAHEPADLALDVLPRRDADLERKARRQPEPSIECRFDGSATATRRVLPQSAGIATIRSSTCSGTDFAASASTPLSARSTSGRWNRTASARAIPSDVATFSSRIACASDEVPLLDATLTSASRSAGT